MKGIGASPGIAIAQAFVLKHEEVVVDTSTVEDVQAQLDRLKVAVDKSREQLKVIQEKAVLELGEEEARIFSAHLMVLDDPEYVGQIEETIKSQKITADNGIKQITDQFVAIFESMDDEYMKERAADIKDVGGRLMRNALGLKEQDLSLIDEDTVVIAYDLTPSDTATMNKEKVLGFATDIGGRTSHTAIMARSLEIPAVLGLKSITQEVKDKDLVIVDGIEGVVIVNPDEKTQKEYLDKKAGYEAFIKELAELKDLPAKTVDGHEVELVGNIGTPKDIEGVLRNGGSGVGLYRTEFLYMDSDTMPDEEKQYKAYKEVLEGMGDHPVIIRTLDIGGDKNLPYLKLDEEMNPFLGLRAVRLCFVEKELFKTQLRAILRASAFGNAHIMFPMISNVEEVKQAKAILEECKEELRKENISFDENIKVGIMVEIPSAAVTADIIAPEVDFFSIGTNDLCQYTLAVDRMNETVSYLYQPLSPAILRLVKMVIDASHNAGGGKFTGMCGELAGDPHAALILLGLGLDEFSMSASSVPQIKKIIRSVNKKDAEIIAEKALKLSTEAEVKAMVDDELTKLDIKLI
ncbi:phosphoenolpyruvate--protein phosphotransferase [Alkalibacter saccharofermentans]|uniref:Phosphoenolpyruvate-protein phosphotransferase n=1 Tax=Alkalibacter saccharofermentans DSM 14828 TaxID=1120975 RepID=A0A1M5A299_9FIRM|nr:phosphoenolpyruvate--protein phosphotransferase [Alkalibacter saccharofermentans]SHF23932.1 phosphoenolpyruvate--protein phosphotransferase [Alkalibacter saccharofermentans DSM 14828]